ncbi:MAG: dynamin family protein, partial [Spirulinaceae cyanobacterium RM2_2_10]|nr:dynamin family protein [Spirulinaceae cyanobacterium RM2_2_10]
MIRRITTNSGWNLLSNVLNSLEKSTLISIDLINTRIRGWTLDIEPLRQRVEAYKQLTKSAIVQIRDVKKLVERQKQQLVAQFKTEISHFAERAKRTLQNEFERFAQTRFAPAAESELTEIAVAEISQSSEDATGAIAVEAEVEIAPLATPFPVPTRIANSLHTAIRNFLQMSDSPYKIRCESLEEVAQVKQEINQFCTLAIKDWWTTTQDELSRQGTQIRQELITEIRENIQKISDEISTHLGEGLDIAMHINPIQILSFEFQGIDAQVQQQTEDYTRLETEHRRAFCYDYEIDFEVDDCRAYYEIDLRQTLEAIEHEIDAQTIGSLAVVKKAIEQQVADDFREAEQQISEYIHRFLAEFDRLLQEREQREAMADEVLATLQAQKEQFCSSANRADGATGRFDDLA